jgi:chaperonin GroEL
MAKKLKFGFEANEQILNGVKTLANAVRVTMGTKGRNDII